MFEMQKKELTKPIAVRLRETEIDFIEEKRKELNMTKSNFIRYCIARAFETEGK